MDREPLAYFLTFITYGSWPHGRESGSVDRDHHAFGTPPLPANGGQEAGERNRMRKPAYTLDEARREVVLRTVIDVTAHRGWQLWAVHVRSNHVHVVITALFVRPEKVLADLKAWASRRLREAYLGKCAQESPDRDRWTQHGSTRYLWDQEDLEAAIEYVIHLQGKPMAVYRSIGFP